MRGVARASRNRTARWKFESPSYPQTSVFWVRISSRDIFRPNRMQIVEREVPTKVGRVEGVIRLTPKGGKDRDRIFDKVRNFKRISNSDADVDVF